MEHEELNLLELRVWETPAYNVEACPLIRAVTLSGYWSKGVMISGPYLALSRS